LNSLHLKSFTRCKRKAWLDFKGKKSYEVWSPHKAIEKINQFKIFSEFCNGEIYAGLKACDNGYQGVIGLKIKGNLFQNINAEILPQLLVKTKGKSKWGKYKYLPAVYKLGHKTTKEHLFDLAFSSMLLESFQESKIEKGLVISSFDRKVVNVEEIYLNKKLRKKVLNVLLSLNACLEGFMPEITQDRKKCTICSWQKFCDKEAKENGYLTDIDGIGSKTALPIFKSFISDSINKYDARPFKAAKGTVMMVVDPLTGQKAKFNSKNTIIEVFKKENVVDGKVLYTNSDRLDSNNILKFY